MMHMLRLSQLSLALTAALALAATGCGKKPKPTDPVGEPTAVTDTAGGAVDAGATTPPTPERPAIVTPKTVDELGQRVVEALVAKDLARMAGYAPADDFVDRNCPEQAPTMRTAYLDKLRDSMNGADARAAECATIDWTGATLATAKLKPSSGVPFYGCAPITDGSVELTINSGTAGEPPRVVQVPRVYMVNGAVYLADMPRCAVTSPCKAIVKHLEELVAASGSAPERAPLDDDQRSGAVSLCESYWTDQVTRGQLACMRGASNYGGIASCGATLSSLFVSWPKK